MTTKPSMVSSSSSSSFPLPSDHDALPDHKIGDGYSLFVKLRERVEEAKKRPKRSAKAAEGKSKKPATPMGQGSTGPLQEEPGEMMAMPINTLIVEFLQAYMGVVGLNASRHMTVLPSSPQQSVGVMGSVASAIGMGGAYLPSPPPPATSSEKKHKSSKANEVRRPREY